MIDELIKSLLVLADVVEARDPYTGGHVWRVSQFSKLLAVKMGCSEKEAIQISLGGFLHDLGKVGIPDGILLKQGKLSEAEYAVIKTHPIIGKKLISSHPLSEMVCKSIVEHHEYINGQGYPRGLSGDEISFAAKIVGVVDMLDALTSARPYRREMPLEKAMQIMEERAGTQFDGEMITHICELGQNGDISHIVGHSAEEIPLVTCPVCGPVIAVQRTARTGDNVFCRACKGKLILHQKENSFEAEIVGKTDDPIALQPEANITAVNDLMKEYAGRFE